MIQIAYVTGFQYGSDHANNGFSVCISTDKIQRKDVVKFGKIYIDNKLIWKEDIKHVNLKNIQGTLYNVQYKTNYILPPFEDIVLYLSSTSYTIRYYFIWVYLSIIFKENYSE